MADEATRQLPGTTTPADASRAADHAFMLLRTVFTVAPIAFGLDKFAGLLTDWEDYLAPWINALVPGTAPQAMLAVGAIAIVSAICVYSAPHSGVLLVAACLAGLLVTPCPL